MLLQVQLFVFVRQKIHGDTYRNAPSLNRLYLTYPLRVPIFLSCYLWNEQSKALLRYSLFFFWDLKRSKDLEIPFVTFFVLPPFLYLITEICQYLYIVLVPQLAQLIVE